VNYRYILTIGVFLFGLNINYGQFGINIRYLSNDFNEWSDLTREFSGGPLWDNNLEFAVDYWFRPNEIRTEYYIEANVGFANTDFTNSSLGSRHNDLKSFGLGIRSHVYIFDFKGDCDCPTFKKEGGLFKKGFFLQYGVGAGLWNKTAESGSNDNNVAVDLHLGAGIDIGISDLLTITPYASYHYLPNVNYTGLIESYDLTDIDGNNSTYVTRFRVGLRIGFRPDFLQDRRAMYR